MAQPIRRSSSDALHQSHALSRWRQRTTWLTNRYTSSSTANVLHGTEHSSPSKETAFLFFTFDAARWTKLPKPTCSGSERAGSARVTQSGRLTRVSHVVRRIEALAYCAPPGRPHRCLETDLACARRCQRRVSTDVRKGFGRDALGVAHQCAKGGGRNLRRCCRPKQVCHTDQQARPRLRRTVTRMTESASVAPPPVDSAATIDVSSSTRVVRPLRPTQLGWSGTVSVATFRPAFTARRLQDAVGHFMASSWRLTSGYREECCFR